MNWNWLNNSTFSKATFESFRSGRHSHMTVALGKHLYYQQFSTQRILRDDKYASELKKYPNYFMKLREKKLKGTHKWT